MNELHNIVEREISVQKSLQTHVFLTLFTLTNIGNQTTCDELKINKYSKKMSISTLKFYLGIKGWDLAISNNLDECR